MKIKGPGGPQEPPGTESVEETKPKSPAGAAFADRLTEADRPGGPGGTGGPPGADPVTALAAELKAGAITPRQAVDRLLDLAVSGPGVVLPDKVRARLRADLEALLRSDPHLASRARRLGLDVDEEG